MQSVASSLRWEIDKTEENMKKLLTRSEDACNILRVVSKHIGLDTEDNESRKLKTLKKLLTSLFE